LQQLRLQKVARQDRAVKAAKAAGVKVGVVKAGVAKAVGVVEVTVVAGAAAGAIVVATRAESSRLWCGSIAARKW
jgi:hypothetical protein